MLWLSAAALLFGYLLGSLPTAYIAARRLAHADIRHLGDGNPGAGNIGRLFGRRWGLLIGAADILKGAIPIFAANLMAGAILPDGAERDLSPPAMLAGAAALAGHICPIWTRGRGGRGAATALGITGAILTLPILLAALPAAAILLATRSTTLALAFIYIAAVIAAPTLFGASWNATAYCLAVFLTVAAAHCWTTRPAQLRNRSIPN